jgi:hypothetical protein
VPAIEARLARHHGNLRDFLFELYDRYEAGGLSEQRIGDAGPR